jgi:hypothetical protein
MRKSTLGLNILLTVASSLFCGSANALTLDFSGLGLSNFDPIPGTYGDVAGSLDVVYSTRFESGNGEIFSNELLFSNNDYSGLVDVALGDLGIPSEIAFLPTPGKQVTLQSFQLGSFASASRPSLVNIYNGDFQLLFSSGEITVAATPLTFTPNLTSTNGIRLQFGPAPDLGTDLGIDNINYFVADIESTPVPFEFSPTLGFGILGGAFLIQKGLKNQSRNKK